mmetsp:Transcript_18482/g.57367  ORF Transcript_18482/g.57367 Transcript_18482/m.57367 type:complete len:255 (-) Transcript_18482:280-1044(-)
MRAYGVGEHQRVGGGAVLTHVPQQAVHARHVARCARRRRKMRVRAQVALAQQRLLAVPQQCLESVVKVSSLGGHRHQNLPRLGRLLHTIGAHLRTHCIDVLESIAQGTSGDGCVVRVGPAALARDHAKRSRHARRIRRQWRLLGRKRQRRYRAGNCNPRLGVGAAPTCLRRRTAHGVQRRQRAEDISCAPKRGDDGRECDGGGGNTRVGGVVEQLSHQVRLARLPCGGCQRCVRVRIRFWPVLNHGVEERDATV